MTIPHTVFKLKAFHCFSSVINSVFFSVLLFTVCVFHDVANLYVLLWPYIIKGKFNLASNVEVAPKKEIYFHVGGFFLL